MSTKTVVARRRERQHRRRVQRKTHPSRARAAREQAFKILGQRYYLPRLEEWLEAITDGRAKTDGATLAPDWICGVEIGRTGDDSWPPLPATLHDFMFGEGGGLGRFLLANRIFRDYLTLYVLHLYHTELWTEGQVKRRVWLYAWGVSTRMARSHFNWRRA